jgi:hypothetical protein
MAVEQSRPEYTSHVRDSEKASQATRVSTVDADSEDKHAKPKLDPGEYPDGGFRAWLIVFGVIMRLSFDVDLLLTTSFDRPC